MSMTNEELLLAMSEMMDTKLAASLKPIENRLDRMDERLDRIEVRLDRVEERLDHVEERLDRVEERLDHVEERLDRVEERLDHVEERLDRMEGKLDHVEERLDHAEGRINRVERKVVKIEVDLLENNVIPRLNTIEACYTSTYQRYQDYADQMDCVYENIKLLNQTVIKHSQILQKIS